MGKEGKLSNKRLGQILSGLPRFRKDVLVGPGIGEDCAAISLGNMDIALTSDPVTATDKHHGSIAVDICINDLASSGAEPIAMMLTVLAPVGTADEEIEAVIHEAGKAAAKYGAEIVGGHTERTSAVNRLVLSMFALGSCPAGKVIKTGGGRPGDYLYMTKYAALEGTFILSDKAGVSAEEKAKIGDMLSVKNDGLIAATAGATAMHDVTEGGILGAIYEMCVASGTGCRVKKADIPVLDATKQVAAQAKIDCYRLIGSGSMLVAIDPSNAEALEKGFSDAGILITKIGVLTDDGKMIAVDGGEDGAEETIQPPGADEIYSSNLE